MADNTNDSSTSCITDTPLQTEADDNLKACLYAKALASFIENADTPVTIGIQGGWGSGKTSLITVLQKQLEEDQEHRAICVLVNAWEHSLFYNADTKAEVVLSLMNGLATGIKERVKNILESEDNWLDESAEEVINPKNDFIENAINIIGDSVKFIRNVTVQAAANMGGLGDVSGAMRENGTKRGEIFSLAENVRKLRLGLRQMIDGISFKGKPVKVALFIDDLDRVPPPTAVEILDITKNIFNIPHCVFVLAIDYEVVIKGLESKYGKKDSKNEREFRQYFDKIIQIPFSMPLGAYVDHISEMLKPAFQKVGYQVQAKDNDLLEKIAEDARLATGGIPRSIKRIINTLSLVRHIDVAKKGRTDIAANVKFPGDMEARFIVIAMHVNFPEICRRIMEWPNFTEWTPETLNLPWKLNVEDNRKELDALVKSGATKEFFEDEWEKVTYCLCAQSGWLKSQAVNVSRLLNRLLEALNGGAKEKRLADSGMETLDAILDSIKVVSIDTDAGNSLQFDDSSVKTDRVTMFFAKLQDELAKKFSPPIVPLHSNEYAKRKDGRGYEIELAEGNLKKIKFKWDTDELATISVLTNQHVKLPKDAKPILDEMAPPFSYSQSDDLFCLFFEKEMRWEDFSQDTLIPEMVEAIEKLVESATKTSQALFAMSNTEK